MEESDSMMQNMSREIFTNNSDVLKGRFTFGAAHVMYTILPCLRVPRSVYTVVIAHDTKR